MTKTLHPLLMQELQDALYVQFTLDDVEAFAATQSAMKVVRSKLKAWGLLDEPNHH